MKEQLVGSNSARLQGIESGEQSVIGVNKYVETAPSPLTTGEGSIMVAEAGVEDGQIARLVAWREGRDAKAVDAALADLKRARRKAATSWSRRLPARKWASRPANGARRCATSSAIPRADGRVERGAQRRAGTRSCARDGRRGVGEARTAFEVSRRKPGLDGHSNGAEQIAVRARDSGMDVVYEAFA